MRKEPTVSVQPAGFDSRMCILSAIGICFVILGHLQTDITGVGTFFNWFPYYSFHMPLFLFISGYFFRDLREAKAVAGTLRAFLQFVWKKFRTFMIPYYVINGIFILLQMLISGNHFFFYPYTVTEYLLMPWTQCQPYTFAIPTWYLAGLFIAEVFYMLLRMAVRALIKKEAAAEVTLQVVTLVMGVCACYVTASLQPPEAALVYLRSVVMLFFLQAGSLYRRCLEKYDRLPSGWYFLIVLALQFLLLLVCKGAQLNFGLYALVGFGRTGFLYFAAGITGILLWLRISRLLDPIGKRSRLVMFVGRNTKYIMAFHLSGFFLFNLLLRALHERGIGWEFLARFNPESLYADPFYYWYHEGGPRFLVLYFLAGMGWALLLAWIIGLVKKSVRRGRG